jgi:cobalt/nickel transport system ATP-binding protein
VAADAEEVLFGQTARPQSHGELRLVVLGVGLVLNAAPRRPQLLALVLSAALALLVAEVRSRRRWALFGGVVISVSLACGLGLAFGLDRDLLVSVALRWASGAGLCLWFSATVPWPAVLTRLHHWRVPQGLIELAEVGVAHGLLLLRSFARKRDAALVRGGRGLRVHAEIFGAGVISAMTRTAALEEARLVRGAPSRRSGAGEAYPILALDDVAVQTKGQFRLRSVSLSIERPGWVALAGPSGAGKTTLLRLIAGLEVPTAGGLLRFGRPIVGRRAEERIDGRVALVFQDPEDQLFASTALDDLLWGLRWRGVTGLEATRRATAALEALGIGHVAGRPIHAMSFGERKRLALASALVSGADIILCDEPTMGLDPVAAAGLAAALEDAVRGRAVTVLWSTHDLAGLPRAVDRIVLLRDGAVVFNGERERGLERGVLERAGLLPPTGALADCPR